MSRSQMVRWVRWVGAVGFVCASHLHGLMYAQTTQEQPPVTTLEPMVARVEMRLTIGEKEVDMIEKGDLLTVLEAREKSYVIRTFRGIKGGVEKNNIVSLAESVEIYDELIKERPMEGRLYTLRAGAWWARGNRESALKDFDEAIKLGYETANAFSSRGLFLLELGEHDKAIADFTTAIDKGEKSESLFVNRAAALVQVNRMDEAIADYTTVLQMIAAAKESSPEKKAGVLQQRATAYKVNGDLENAIKDYTAAIELTPSFIPAILGRGYVYFQQGDHEKAIADFGKVIELNPKASVALNNRGYNLLQVGKFAEALKDFDAAIAIAPEYALAFQNKAWLLATCSDSNLRNPKEAIAAATKACELNQYNDLADMAALAAAHAAAKDFATAIGVQEKIVERAPAPQKPLAEKLLERYKDGKEFTFDLAVDEPTTAPPSSNAEPKSEQK